MFFDSGVGGVVGFPYYLIYDLGEGNEAAIGSFSLTNAGASLSYYQNGDNHLNLFGACYGPTEFELRATNLPPNTAGEAEAAGDATVATHMLDKNTTLLWSHESPKSKDKIKKVQKMFKKSGPQSGSQSGLVWWQKIWSWSSTASGHLRPRQKCS